MGEELMLKNYVKILVVLFACTVLLSACGSKGDSSVANSTKEVPSSNQKVNSESTDWDKIPDSDFDYKYDSDLQGVEVRYKGSASKVRFPDKINGDPVVSIGQSNSKTPASIKAVYIPNSVKVIGGGAFKGYTGLTDVTIPDGVTEIGLGAFKNCESLTSLTIPNSVKTIDIALQDCKGLTSITLSNNLTSIAPDTFMGCTALTKVTIPDSVTSIGGYAFTGCSKLADITFPKEVDKVAIAGDAFESTYWYDRKPDGIIRIGNTVIGYKGDKPASITIPDGVTRISDNGFRMMSDKLTSVTIPDSVTSIGDEAFNGCYSLDAATRSRIRQINPKAQLSGT